MSRTVVLVGGAPSWTHVPQGVDYDVWCTSTVFQRLSSSGRHGIKKVFQLHGENTFEPWLASIVDRAVIIRPSDKAPKASVLPHRVLRDLFDEHFTSTVAWMMAYALFLHYDRILLYGFNMHTGEEYYEQRDELFYFWGRAEGMGVRVIAAPGSGVEMKRGRYGLKESE